MSEDSPQCVQSYSVSFCDNMNTSDSTPLLGADQSDDELDPSEDRTTLKPNHMSIQRESPIFISPTTKHLNKALSCYSSSCPVNSHDVSWCNACFLFLHKSVLCYISQLFLVQISVDDEEDHCHRERKNKNDKKARRKLWFASILCLVFMICEIVGGYFSGSLAIATDAAHLLTDFASFMISLIALWVASRPATKQMPFGWYRAEVLGALTSVLLIWVVTGILLYIAIERVITKNFDIEPTIMLYTSVFGLIVNVLMGCTLHQHSHSHGGVREDVNVNVRAAFIHVLGDFLQSFGVFVAAVVIYFKPEWVLVDPICTFLFALLVLATTFTILRDIMIVLMEGIPRGVEFTDVLNTFLDIEGVEKVHNLRIWALSLDKAALSAHLAVKPGTDAGLILKQASRLVHTKFDFFEMTLQIEEFNATMEACDQCQSPAQ
ncbi:zinc transporter 2-like [Diaphorina citri]|uniref:Zinc transporter 2-like n=1 Tax=Diaphorina citri TaxID=121845 RepID=A0A3Q0IJF8_DIACI|nr:zinc transporter 2-like [Diaphorina citri]